MGLNPVRDRLCLVQLSAGDGTAHLVQLRRGRYAAPNLRRLLGDPGVLKLFHFARFDLAMLRRYLGVMRAGLLHQDRLPAGAHLHRSARPEGSVRELLGIELVKQQQSSDWGAAELSETQLPTPPTTCCICTRCARGSTRCWSARAARSWRGPASTSCRRAPRWISPAGATTISSRIERGAGHQLSGALAIR